MNRPSRPLFRSATILPASVLVVASCGLVASAVGQVDGISATGTTVRIVGGPTRTVADSDKSKSPLQVRVSQPPRPCVLLKNDNVLFGTARQLGRHVIVQTGPNAELKLLRTEVACWANSLADLYQYRLDHRLEVGVEAHLRDARWCLQYGLTDQAAAEIRAAAELQPDHRSLLLLKRRLELQQQPRTSAIEHPPKVVMTGFEQPTAPSHAGTEAPSNPRQLAPFAAHVQPVLINRCGRCHDQRSDRAWRITVPAPGTRPSARITRANLAATLLYVDPTDPDNSELLRQATTPHGMVAAPLGPRNQRALAALKWWVGSVSDPDDPAQITSRGADDMTSEGRGEFDPDQHSPQAAEQPAVSSGSGEPSRLPAVDNPLDPNLFNRRYHGAEP